MITTKELLFINLIMHCWKYKDISFYTCKKMQENVFTVSTDGDAAELLFCDACAGWVHHSCIRLDTMRGDDDDYNSTC